VAPTEESWSAEAVIALVLGIIFGVCALLVCCIFLGAGRRAPEETDEEREKRIRQEQQRMLRRQGKATQARAGYARVQGWNVSL